MSASSKYWALCRLNGTRAKAGYEYYLLSPAKSFFQQLFTNLVHLQSRDIYLALLTQFHDLDAKSDAISRAHAGLCLRCYVSYSILKACQTIESRFTGDKQFTYQDLLPFVLNDDGKSLILLDREANIQLTVDDTGEVFPSTFKVFAVEVLRTYRPNTQASKSLENWAFLQTKQHPELRAFLTEFGFKHLSNWALLNRARLKQLEQLPDGDRQLVEIFHQVYRRDRRQQRQLGPCLDPTEAQLIEMAKLLQQQGPLSPQELMKRLRQVASQLRNLDIWQSREPLEIQNLETGDYELRADLPPQLGKELDAEEQEFLDFLQEQVNGTLPRIIEQAIQAQIAYLQKSKRYAPFATCYVAGLHLYYGEGLSLRDIGPRLGMSSWDQTRRILNPGELLNNIRLRMVQQLLEPILEQAQSKGLASKPPEPSYLKTLTEQIEAFLDAEIFEEAASEIKAGKNRAMDSVYAQHLKHYINNI